MSALTEEGIPALDLSLDGGKLSGKAVFSPAGVELACSAIALLPGNAIGFPWLEDEDEDGAALERLDELLGLLE